MEIKGTSDYLGDDGVYYLYRRLHEPHGVAVRLLGRFTLSGGVVEVLEDYDNMVEDMFPTGSKLDDRMLSRMDQLAHSPYWALTHEHRG